MNTIDITPIVNAALVLIGAGVSVFLIPWLNWSWEMACSTKSFAVFVFGMTPKRPQAEA